MDEHLTHPRSVVRLRLWRRGLLSASWFCLALAATRRKQEVLRRHSFLRSRQNAGLDYVARTFRLAANRGSLHRIDRRAKRR
jgi:hypothetical protein